MELDDEYVTFHLDKRRFEDFLNDYNEWKEELAENVEDFKEEAIENFQDAFSTEEDTYDYDYDYDYDYSYDDSEDWVQ